MLNLTLEIVYTSTKIHFFLKLYLFRAQIIWYPSINNHKWLQTLAPVRFICTESTHYTAIRTFIFPIHLHWCFINNNLSEFIQTTNPQSLYECCISILSSEMKFCYSYNKLYILFLPWKCIDSCSRIVGGSIDCEIYCKAKVHNRFTCFFKL